MRKLGVRQDSHIHTHIHTAVSLVRSCGHIFNAYAREVYVFGDKNKISS